jgi:hypothetical protein
MSLSNSDDTGKPRPRPGPICDGINEALSSSPHHQIKLSAARWTAKGNLILTGGPQVTAQQLTTAHSFISSAIAGVLADHVNIHSPPPIRANVKWSKLLINGVPTGVTSKRGSAYSREECHSALVTDNPSYAPLIVTQKPSWVRAPSSYTVGTSSSLVVAFEDPDGSKAKALLAAKYLYAFGSRVSVKKWKQRTTKSQTTHSPMDADNEEVDIILNHNTATPAPSSSQVLNLKRKAQLSPDQQSTASTKGRQPARRKINRK